MLLGAYRQAPTDRRLYNLDYSSWLQPGETITGFSWTGTPSSPTPATIDAYNINSPATSVTIYISGGVDAVAYRLFIKAATSLGQNKEDEIRVNCVDPATQPA